MKLIVHFLIFYFSIGAAIPNCDFSQLLTLNNVHKHYQLHQAEAIIDGTDIGIWEFLNVHFFNTDDHQHQEDGAHEHFPLQQIQSSITLFVNPIFNFSFWKIDGLSSVLHFFDTNYKHRLCYRIFHPPIF